MHIPPLLGWHIPETQTPAVCLHPTVPLHLGQVQAVHHLGGEAGQWH